MHMTKLLPVLAAILLLWSSSASAQSMIVIGGDSYAKECFQLSNQASMTGIVGTSDIEVCDKAINYASLKLSDLVATYVNRGVLKVRTGDLKGAVQDYNRAIEIQPTTAEAFINRGNLWFTAQHYQEAIADYDKSLELKLRKAHIALLNKGMALEGMGQLTQAKENYLAALERNPDWSTALSKLERVSKKLEQARR